MANGSSGPWVPSLAKRVAARQGDADEQIRIVGEFVDDMYSSINRRLDQMQIDQATGFANLRTEVGTARAEVGTARAEVKDEMTSFRRALLGGVISIIVALVATITTLLVLVR